MSSQFNYFKQNKTDIKGVLHVGAHRGEEIYDYESMGAEEVIWVEPVPELFEEMKTFLSTAQCSVNSYAYEYAASNVDHEQVNFHLYYGPLMQHICLGIRDALLYLRLVADLNLGLREQFKLKL